MTTEVRVMQLFIKVADMALFLMPYNELHSIGPHLALFELATVRRADSPCAAVHASAHASGAVVSPVQICSVEGNGFCTDRMQELADRHAARPAPSLLGDMLDSLLERPKELARYLTSYFLAAPELVRHVCGRDRARDD
jgi:hypothetical protein